VNCDNFRATQWLELELFVKFVIATLSLNHEEEGGSATTDLRTFQAIKDKKLTCSLGL
jgi:hypothetical protein